MFTHVCKGYIHVQTYDKITVWQSWGWDGSTCNRVVSYIDGSFVKHKIPVRPIYITVRNLNSIVSGKARAWRVLAMMPSVRKSATLAQSDQWRKERRLRLHHACIAHVVDMVG